MFVQDDDDSATHDVLSDIFPPIFLPEHRNLSRSFCSSQAAECGFVFGWERSKKNDSSGVFISCDLLVTCFGGMFLTRTKEKIARARVRMDGRCRHTSVFAFACLHGFLGLVSLGKTTIVDTNQRDEEKICCESVAAALVVLFIIGRGGKTGGSGWRTFALAGSIFQREGQGRCGVPSAFFLWGLHLPF